MAACGSFRKNGRGRPSLDLPCSLCGVIYRFHDTGKVTSAAAKNPLPEAQEENPPPKPEPKKVDVKDIQHILDVFPTQATLEDW